MSHDEPPNMRFSVYRPFKDGWQTVIQIPTFEAAIAHARTGCRYKRLNKMEDADHLVMIQQEIEVDGVWRNWHGWFVNSENATPDFDKPKTRTSTAWDVYEGLADVPWAAGDDDRSGSDVGGKDGA